MLPCRSISHIETFFPFFKFRANECHFECTLCTSYVATLTTSDKKEYVFKYDSVNGVDFTNNHLKEHVTQSGCHINARICEINREKEFHRMTRVSVNAGYTLGRLAYSIIYRGRPYSDFTMDVLVGFKNDAVTGDINHRRVFIPQFLTACAGVLRRKLARYLSTPLDFTGGKVPPVGLSCNKMTEKRRSGQITAIATLYPGKELSPDEVVQTLFIGNPVVRNHTG